MKKVKIMLFSLALIAVVGGALAFKAKYTESYCTALTVQGKACTELAACPNLVVNSSQTNNVNFAFVCTTTPVLGECPADLPCTTTSTRLRSDGPGN